MTDAQLHDQANQDEARIESPLGLLFRLAWPTVLARAGILVMALVDIVMLGRYDADELAFASLGVSLFVPPMVVGIGLVMGVMILSAQAYGSGDARECGAVWRRGFPWALTLGAGTAVFCLFGETWLRLLGHAPALVEGGGAVARTLALGAAAQIVYVVCVFHLEATRRPLPGMIAMGLANLVNVALNWVFIYGNLGAPELGALGSALTTTAVRVFLLAGILIYILRPENRTRYDLPNPFALRLFGKSSWRGFWGPGGWAAGAKMRRLGGAAGASIFFETTAYAAVMQFAGYLGAGALGAYAIAHNTEATIFMVALGLGSATAVLVGNAAGARDPERAAGAAWLGLRAVIGVMAVCGATIWLADDWIAAGYAAEPELAARAAPLFAFVGLAILFDGAQLVMGQVARALGDAWVATRLYALSFWGVLVPAAWLFGLHWGYGERGLLLGVALGCAVSFVLLVWRVRYLLGQLREEAAQTSASRPSAMTGSGAS